VLELGREERSSEDVLVKLDLILSILKIIGRNSIEEAKKSVVSTRTKEKIFELCNGRRDLGDIAKIAGTSEEYVRLTVKELEEAGLVTAREARNKRLPMKVI